MPPDHLLQELAFGNGIRFPQTELGQEGMSDGILAARFPTSNFQQYSNIESIVQLSHEKNPGWLGYIRDSTTQLYGDYNKPL